MAGTGDERTTGTVFLSWNLELRAQDERREGDLTSAFVAKEEEIMFCVWR
jgi:hypothetical protein